jgi:hypothetical protein
MRMVKESRVWRDILVYSGVYMWHFGTIIRHFYHRFGAVLAEI